MVFEIVAHTLIGMALVIMGAAIAQSNKLMEILKGSKVETNWKRSQYSIIFLTFLFLVIMITRLVGDKSEVTKFLAEGEAHEMIMNTSFLITAILFLFMVNLDIRAFQSLFKLLDQSEVV